MARVAAAGATDTGRVRTRNEDAYFVGSWVFAVADGLGGHPAGDVASATALQPLQELDERERDERDTARRTQDVRAALVQAVEEAHGRVRAGAAEDPARAGMGTTLTAVAVSGGQLTVAHVGDSRCYLLRGGVLTQLSVDHTPVQMAVDAGQLDPEAAEHHPGRHVLAQAIGLEEEVEVDTRGATTLEPGDRVLLCSDGLTEMLSNDEIGRLLAGEDDPAGLAELLVTEAVQAGGVDNVTTVVLLVQT